MKRLITFVVLAVLLSTAGFAARQKDLSGPIAIKGEQQYENFPAGTPVVIRKVVKMKSADQAGPDIFYATEINGMQFAVPASALKTIKLSPPETNQEFWQQTYLKQHLYKYFGERGYNSKLRKEVDEECRDYLYKLEEIGYEDDFITSYVQNIFAKLTATGIDPNRSERLNVRVIQSPEPDAYMLPNGTMLISTGLLCTLDSEDELAAIIANEMSHFVLDHQVNNIYRAERRATCTAKHVANPGCFATCIQLGLLPLAKHLMLNGDIMVNAITGSTGAGVKPGATSHFSWRNNNLSVYKAFEHQHVPEIKQSLKQLQNSFDSDIDFIPYRGDFPRGIFTTIVIKTKVALEEIVRMYEEYYAKDSFTHIVGKNIDLKQVVNTNKCLIHLEKHGDKLLIISCIDNLLKGASGQAVHNMNLMFNLEETVGLRLKPSAF